MITFYTTDCPKCKVLESKMNAKGIPYIIETNIESLIEKGFRTTPMIEVDDQFMEFSDAIKWVNEQ